MLLEPDEDPAPSVVAPTKGHVKRKNAEHKPGAMNAAHYIESMAYLGTA